MNTSSLTKWLELKLLVDSHEIVLNNFATYWKAFLGSFPNSDYGYERHSNGQCLPAFWFNPSSLSKDCSLGQSYLNSTGWVSEAVTLRGQPLLLFSMCLTYKITSDQKPGLFHYSTTDLLSFITKHRFALMQHISSENKTPVVNKEVKQVRRWWW